MTIESIVSSQRNFFNTNLTKDLSFRKDALEKLLDAIEEYKPAIFEALKKDLGKSEQEAYMTEVGLVTNSIRIAISHLRKWAKPVRHKTPLTHFPAKSYVMSEPYGVVLIMAPWNYPFFLSMAPLVGAIAAGNCVVLKTSRSSSNTSEVIANIINSTFSSTYICALDTKSEYNEILNCTYDYIFFTGSERVGRIVMRHASETLTPVTLELGGKSPCIIDRSANLKLAAKRIVFGKLLNSGQTCVAPDYVVIPSDKKEAFVSYLQKYSQILMPNALNNEDYPKIINLHHFIRLKNLIGNASAVVGGRIDEKSFKIEPAFFTEASFEDDIMKNEIFGPILPIIAYEDLDEVLDIIKHRPKPLACYIFGKKRSFQKKVISTISFGGGCINDTIMHVANEHLPFGGVGQSGMGCYHGRYSFDTFSHKKSILTKGFLDIKVRYSPYTPEKYRLIRFLLK